MNNEPKIITGLKLSEAIKYCEENEGALIANQGTDIYDKVQNTSFYVGNVYSVKLPPPKSVSVNLASIKGAWVRHVGTDWQGNLNFDKFCKELGL